MMNLRSVIRTSFCLAAAALAAPATFGASADKQQAQAQLLDHAEFLCQNCFFAPSQYYYCFAAGNQILIGYQSTPVFNYEDKSKNYLTTVHRAWTPFAAPAQPIPISYDDKHIWVSRSDAPPAKQDFWSQMKSIARWDRKQVKLTRSSMHDIFTNDARCRVADSVKTH